VRRMRWWFRCLSQTSMVLQISYLGVSGGRRCRSASANTHCTNARNFSAIWIYVDELLMIQQMFPFSFSCGRGGDTRRVWVRLKLTRVRTRAVSDGGLFNNLAVPFRHSRSITVSPHTVLPLHISARPWSGRGDVCIYVATHSRGITRLVTSCSARRGMVEIYFRYPRWRTAPTVEMVEVAVTLPRIVRSC